MNIRAVKRIADDGSVTVYPSIEEAARKNFVHRSCINNALLGTYKTSIGFRWEYADGFKSREIKLTTPDGKVHYYPTQAAAAKAHGFNINTLRTAMAYGRDKLMFCGCIIERIKEDEA